MACNWIGNKALPKPLVIKITNILLMFGIFVNETHYLCKLWHDLHWTPAYDNKSSNTVLLTNI